MTDKSAAAEAVANAGSFLEWEVKPGETRLLLEEDSVYAADLVQLGLGWQDFGGLVVRAES